MPLVATNEPYFARPEDYAAHDALLCIADGEVLATADRRRVTPEHYFKSPQEMAEVFGDLPEALANTIRIAEMCSLDLGFKGYKLPQFETPDNKPADLYLEELCREGVRRLYGHDSGEVGARLEYELGVIKSMDFANYFLVVWDFVKFAKDSGILVGPGRGSAAGR